MRNNQVSAKTENGVSLNDCSETGPSLLPELVSVLRRYVRKMYLQVRLKGENSDVFRYLRLDMDF